MSNDITPAAQKVIDALATGRFTFFDDGMVEGSNTWGDVFADELRDLFPPAAIGGVVAGLVSQGIVTHTGLGEDDVVVLTAKGAALVADA